MSPAPQHSNDLERRIVDVAIGIANTETALRLAVADMKELRGLLRMLLEASTPVEQLALISQALKVADRALGKL